MDHSPRAEFRTKAQIVFDEMRRRIAEGVLGPGARLRLRTVAEEFDCSEIPVREAFRSLAAVGLVDLVPHGGAHVSTLQADDIVDLTEIRALLEPEATVRAMPHLGNEALAQLEALEAEMEDAASRTDGAAFGRINRQFHGLIIDRCPNRKLVELVNDLWERAERGRLVFRDGPAHLAESVVQHRDLLAALRTRDADALRRTAVAHSRFGLDAVRRLSQGQGPLTALAVGTM